MLTQRQQKEMYRRFNNIVTRIQFKLSDIRVDKLIKIARRDLSII